MGEFEVLLRDALIVTAVLTLPVLGLATLVGLVVAVLQAATQIQEQTLTLLPKVIVVGAVVTAGGAYGMQLCAALFVEALAQIPALVRGG
ncbi:MAG: flagellar biosynthetic protein FliQ [Candidatus Velthaea sp.]